MYERHGERESDAENVARGGGDVRNEKSERKEGEEMDGRIDATMAQRGEEKIGTRKKMLTDFNDLND